MLLLEILICALLGHVRLSQSAFDHSFTDDAFTHQSHDQSCVPPYVNEEKIGGHQGKCVACLVAPYQDLFLSNRSNAQEGLCF